MAPIENRGDILDLNIVIRQSFREYVVQLILTSAVF
jgi:hypothetical protein